MVQRHCTGLWRFHVFTACRQFRRTGEGTKKHMVWMVVLALLCLVQESILSSAWCGGKSRLEQMVERQQATMRALLSSHTEKLARLKQQDRL